MEALHNAVQVSRVEQRFDGGFRQVEVSPNGELLATDNLASPNTSSNKVTIWDLARSDFSRTLVGPGEVIGLASSPDGHLAVGYLEGAEHDRPSFRIWDPTTGEELRRFPVPVDWIGQWHVSRLAFSPDGALLAATVMGQKETVFVWDTQGGDRLFSKSWIDVDSPHELDVTFLDNGTLLVARSNADEVVFYDVASNEQRRVIPTTDFRPYRLAVDRQNNRLITADVEGSVAAWNLDDGKPWWSVRSDEPLDDIPALDVADSGLVAVSGKDGEVRLLETESLSNVGILAGHEGIVFDVMFNSDGEHLHSVSTDGTARTWDVTPAGPPPVNRPLPHPDDVIQIDVSADGAELAVQSKGGSFDLIDVVTGEVRSLEDQALDIPNGAAVSPNWSYLASVDYDDPDDPDDPDDSWVMQLSTFEKLMEFPACTNPKAFSPDGSLLVLSVCDDPSVWSRVIDWKTGVELLDLGAANSSMKRNSILAAPSRPVAISRLRLVHTITLPLPPPRSTTCRLEN